MSISQREVGRVADKVLNHLRRAGGEMKRRSIISDLGETGTTINLALKELHKARLVESRKDDKRDGPGRPGLLFRAVEAS